MDLEGLTLEPVRQATSSSYNFIELVFLITSSVISGAKNSVEIERFGLKNLNWLKKYRSYSSGIPPSRILEILISRIAPVHFYNIFINFLNQLRRSLRSPEITYRCLRFPPDIQTALNTVSICIRQFKFVITQHKFNVKRNEQQAVLEILDALIIRNALITVYAKNTQKKIANKIIQKKGEYIILLKQNYKKFTEELMAYFHKANREKSKYIESHNELCAVNHYREYRKLGTSNWLSENLSWRKIKSIFQIKLGSPFQQKIHFYLSSLDLNTMSLSGCIASHWSIEGLVHWHLDIAYDKQHLAFKSAKTAKKLTALKRLVRYLAYLHPLNVSIKQKLKMTHNCKRFKDELLLGLHSHNGENIIEKRSPLKALSDLAVNSLYSKAKLYYKRG